MTTQTKSRIVKTAKRACYILSCIAFALLATDFFTSSKEHPIGNGIVTTAWVKYAAGSQPLAEVDRNNIESAVLDIDNSVFVMHYYIPDDPRTTEQNEILEHLNSYYGGSVTFLKLDLSKHQDIPFCAGIKTPSVITYTLTRANSDRHKMTGHSMPLNPHCNSYRGLLAAIQYLRLCEYDDKANPREWGHTTVSFGSTGSNAGSTTVSTDDSGVASRHVPFWSWANPEHDWAMILRQQ